MNFTEAFKAMKKGSKAKLPGWGGYWYWDEEKQTVMIQCRPRDADNGPILDIRETERVEYTLMNMQRDDWMIADETNCPVLGGEATFSFGEAIKYLKRGMKVTRKVWKREKQYIQLVTVSSCKTTQGEIGNMEIAFCLASGVQMGWLASQADMLADDWVFAE